VKGGRWEDDGGAADCIIVVRVRAKKTNYPMEVPRS